MKLVERIKDLNKNYLHKQNKDYILSDFSASGTSYIVAIVLAHLTTESTLSSLEKALLNSTVKTGTYLFSNLAYYKLLSRKKLKESYLALKELSIGNFWGIVVADSMRIGTYFSVLEFEIAEGSLAPLIAYPLAGVLGKGAKYGINYKHKLIGTKDKITNF